MSSSQLTRAEQTIAMIRDQGELPPETRLLTGGPVMKDFRLKLRDATEKSHALAEKMIELLKLREEVRKAEGLAAVKQHKSRRSTSKPE